MKKQDFMLGAFFSKGKSVLSALGIATALLFAPSCGDDYDDTEIKNSIASLEQRVSELEKMCTAANSEISSLKTLLNAVEARDYVTAIEEIDGGYKITFADKGEITLYHGLSPIVGVAKHTDGKYYWTVSNDGQDATWLTDDKGNKIPVTGEKGEAALAPQLKTGSQLGSSYEKTAVYISVDNGKTWMKISGEKGDKGDKGDTGEKGDTGSTGSTGASGNLKSIKQNNDHTATITLTDGSSFTVPLVSDLLEIKAVAGKANTFTLTSGLLESGSGNVVDIRIESLNADGIHIETRAISDTRWTIESSTNGTTMTISATPATSVGWQELALMVVTVSNKAGKVLASGRITFVNGLVSEGQKVVSDANGLKEALKDDAVTYIALEEDLSLSEEGQLLIKTAKEIDLNGKTFTASTEIQVSDGGSLSISNGNIVQTGESIYNQSNGSIQLDNVKYEGSGESCIFNNKNAQNAQITIRNSNIKGGYYAVTTNASTNPVGSATILLENSTFEADETALLINVPSTVTVRNCTFTSGWQAAFLRGGTYTFTDCTFNLNMDENYNDVPEDHKSEELWADGNQAEGAALLIGNRCNENASGYDYPTSVTLTNAKFSVTGTAKSSKTIRTAAETPSVYIWSRVEEGNGTTFNYDAASEASFKQAGKGLFIGNEGKNLTVNGSSYVSE